MKNINSKYYSENADLFIESTLGCDMTYQYNLFEKYLDCDAKTILDLGFGSGRDSLYFKSKGYDVYSLDPVEEFSKHGIEIGLDNVICLPVEEMPYIDVFDGIWACASLLHIEEDKLSLVFKKCHKSLKSNGVMYCSFKYGTYSGERNKRFFTDMTLEKLSNFIDLNDFDILESVITEDVRVERENEKWLNVVLLKK